MKFYEGGIFHIFNQGNNRQRIFYSDENYEFFTWKMKQHLLPFGHLLTWCLMPNHFHFQFLVESIDIERYKFRKHFDDIEMERRYVKYGDRAKPLRRPDGYYAPDKNMANLNLAIGKMLSSYSRALNHVYGCSGSVFRGGCKAKDLYSHNLDWGFDEEETINPFSMSYLERCHRYIHLNPVKAGLCNSPCEYLWSSAREYAGLVNSPISNIELGKEHFEPLINFSPIKMTELGRSVEFSE